jgi:glutamate synthase (NADPH/NADH) large chain
MLKNQSANYEFAQGLPPAQGLYDPRFEHDACGIGFVAHIEGRRTHAILEMGLEALCNHAHRGAVADDRKTGDGAGILTQLPYEFFKRELMRVGIQPPAVGDSTWRWDSFFCSARMPMIANMRAALSAPSVPNLASKS